MLLCTSLFLGAQDPPAWIQGSFKAGAVTFNVAYEDGQAAFKRGDYRKALMSFKRAAELRPQPGCQIRTYGTNYLATYYPWLYVARSALALGEWDEAAKALEASNRYKAEPAEEREELLQKLKQARSKALTPTPPSAVQASEPVQAPPPKEIPVASPPATKELPPEPDPPKPSLVLPPPTEASKPKLELPGPKPVEPKPSSGTLQEPASIPNPPKSETDPTPALQTSIERPFPSLSLVAATSVGLTLLGLGLGLLFGSRKKRRSRKNPYRVDLHSTGREEASETTQKPSDQATTPCGRGSSADFTTPIPRQVGPYRIHGVLGRGGCATTYYAEHEEDGSEAAIKIPHPHILVDAEFLARFRREAALGALLDHPRIVRILDPGPEEGDPWLAMTFVRGVTLESHLQKTRPLPMNQVIYIAADIADAIAHAHSKGVVHRDLKPANIMLGDIGAQVMDFGIARMLDTSFTSTTIFIGTPAYSAPEALANPRVGPPADRYALGIVLFEMLTGKQPFTAETAFQVLEMHRGAALPDLKQLRPETPPRLVRLVERLCQKNPADRPEDGEVIQILEELKAEHPL